MKRSFVEIYGLAVCFVTLLCFVIALGAGIYDLLQVAFPEFTLNAYEYERHQSNDSFRNAPRSRAQWTAPPSRGPGPGIAEAVPIPDSTEDETTRQREDSYRSVLRAERRQAGQSLVMVGIVMLIDVLVFFPHWILARRARVNA